jgi:hypothetical protein
MYIGTTDGAEPKRLRGLDSPGVYVAPDHVLFRRQTALVAQRFNLSQGALIGDPVAIADPVGQDTYVGTTNGFGVSANGIIAYRAGGVSRTQLVWFDRAGKQIGLVGETESTNLMGPELSPDGRWVAVDRTAERNRDVWFWDLLRRGWTRFTSDPLVDGFPIWSPDGTQLAFESTRKGPFDVYLKASSQTAPEQPLIESADSKWPLDWSRDGRFLLYHVTDPKTGFDLMAKGMSGANASPSGLNSPKMTGDARNSIVIANTRFAEDNGQFSPNGQWVAFQTNESGRNEIVVQSFPNPTNKLHVSTEGGSFPRWRSDGKELYFSSLDAKLMAATVRSSPNGLVFDVPVPLFQTNMNAVTVKTPYAVSGDGRFLVNQRIAASDNTPITLILNWHSKDSK